jgi:hypothetical protein
LRHVAFSPSKWFFSESVNTPVIVAQDSFLLTISLIRNTYIMREATLRSKPAATLRLYVVDHVETRLDIADSPHGTRNWGHIEQDQVAKKACIFVIGQVT